MKQSNIKQETKEFIIGTFIGTILFLITFTISFFLTKLTMSLF
jgi:hypothetical protein